MLSLQARCASASAANCLGRPAEECPAHPRPARPAFSGLLQHRHKLPGGGNTRRRCTPLADTPSQGSSAPPRSVSSTCWGAARPAPAQAARPAPTTIAAHVLSFPVPRAYTGHVLQLAPLRRPASESVPRGVVIRPGGRPAVLQIRDLSPDVRSFRRVTGSLGATPGSAAIPGPPELFVSHYDSGNSIAREHRDSRTLQGAAN